MCGTKDAAQCFDVASEKVMTAVGYGTGKCSACLCHSSAVTMCVFRHGDDFVLSGMKTQQRIRGYLIVTALGDVTKGQDIEQDCEMCQTYIRIGT